MATKTEFVRGDEIDAMDKLHDAAMSPDQLRACEGRGGKAMVSFISAFIEAEARRGTDPNHVLLTGVTLALSVFFTVLTNVSSKTARHAEIAETARELFLRHYDACVAELRRRPEVD